MDQLSFLAPENLPPGLSYFPGFISPEEEELLLSEFKKLELRPYEFQGYTAKRKVLHFQLHGVPPLPGFLIPFHERAAQALKLPVSRITQILVTHFPVSAPIGWHRDAPAYEHLLGISLGSECVMSLREMSGTGKVKLPLARRSAYVMTGPARWRWEHHIPPVKDERYSLTFRTLVSGNPVRDHDL